MNYENMSDFDINLRVACALDGVPVRDDGTPEFAIDCFLRDGGGVAVKWCSSNDDSEYKSFNPCNNPSDSWPLIVDNGICTHNALGSRSFASSFDSLGDVNRRWYCDNVLRAAMIVFLMMRANK